MKSDKCEGSLWGAGGMCSGREVERDARLLNEETKELDDFEYEF
jgi:hypothetical protein